MSQNIFHAKSLDQLAEHFGLKNSKHPLICIMNTEDIAYGEEYIGMKYSADMYCIALKDKSCGLDYGRNHYDFNEGVLIFTAPEQVLSVRKAQQLGEVKGWMMYFHSDLIRNTSLGQKIDDYSFFNYEVHEALHLSQQEQDTLTQIVNLIREEIEERIDNHTQQVLVSNIELLLNYSLRFYQRQFNTRSAQNTDIVSKVEVLLKDYYKNNELVESGQPTIQYLADQCNISASYLSDLLAKETGRSAKDHINDFIIDKAKNMLLNSSDSISGIAYTLGFNYPHYFGRLFKQKTGKTPQQYRSTIAN
ncbi:helix-turn-helix domain-containing protein [Flammeovirga aprica]|uniref:Helix-turn-helix transcriptional regulator n=1 Tax=Flammeovirga aprica JL-4 TaxID=694437 RepID=A0A7X9P079_9BACT|nr:helix-turn-helix domain-containing protein [Flammeovirga aprica]NME67030.1 helix-turn-helix transcriptional regulator [Flammeovirga aprica JL-4]